MRASTSQDKKKKKKQYIHSSKESASNAGDTQEGGNIPGLGRPPEVGNDKPIQYSCHI